MRSAVLSDADIAVLAKLPLFRGIDPVRRARLLSGARCRRYGREEGIFTQGDPAEAFFVVLRGWVKLFRLSEEGEESVIGVFSEGESFAEAAMFDRSEYPVSAAAATEADLVVIPGGSFLNHLAEDPACAVAIMAAMSRHMRQLVRQIEQLSTRSAPQRLAGFLIRLAGRTEGAVELSLPLEKALIANRLGMKPETFSRALAKLVGQGVTRRGEALHIADLAHLDRFAEGGQ